MKLLITRRRQDRRLPYPIFLFVFLILLESAEKKRYADHENFSIRFFVYF
jgi:hypothetical protein